MPLKSYSAVVWKPEPDAIGVRVTVIAKDLQDAEKKLKQEHGERIRYTLYNEEDADKAR